MRRKIVLLAFLVSGGLFGMDNKYPVWDNKNQYYVQVGKPHLYKGAHICKQAHPLFVIRACDDTVILRFNFDEQIRSAKFEQNGLVVTLCNAKTYKINNDVLA